MPSKMLGLFVVTALSANVAAQTDGCDLVCAGELSARDLIDRFPKPNGLTFDLLQGLGCVVQGCVNATAAPDSTLDFRTHGCEACEVGNCTEVEVDGCDDGCGYELVHTGAEISGFSKFLGVFDSPQECREAWIAEYGDNLDGVVGQTARFIFGYGYNVTEDPLTRRGKCWAESNHVYQDCVNLDDPLSLGDGECDAENNNENCGWDGGDCCSTTCGVSPQGVAFAGCNPLGYYCLGAGATPLVIAASYDLFSLDVDYEFTNTSECISNKPCDQKLVDSEGEVQTFSCNEQIQIRGTCGAILAATGFNCTSCGCEIVETTEAASITTEAAIITTAAPADPTTAVAEEPTTVAAEDPTTAAAEDPTTAAAEEPTTAAAEPTTAAAEDEPTTVAATTPIPCDQDQLFELSDRNVTNNCDRLVELFTNCSEVSAKTEGITDCAHCGCVPDPTTTAEATTVAPAEPTTAAAEEPTTAAAEEPTTAAAEEPTTAAAEEPTTAAAEEPTTAAAEEPTTAAAEEPTTAAAEEPTTAAAEEPTTAAAEEEATTVAAAEPTTVAAAEVTTGLGAACTEIVHTDGDNVDWNCEDLLVLFLYDCANLNTVIPTVDCSDCTLCA